MAAMMLRTSDKASLLLRLSGRPSLLNHYHHQHHSFCYPHPRNQSTISSTSTTSHGSSQAPHHPAPAPAPPTKSLPSLAIMPTSLLLRSLLVTSILSSPRLLNVCLPLMTRMANSHSVLLDPDRNPLLSSAVRILFYNHFCAGTNVAEVKRTVKVMKDMGFRGVILGYAKEFIADPKMTREEAAEAGAVAAGDAAAAVGRRAIEEWREGNLKTLPMIGNGDFLGIKFTGAGPHVTRALAQGEPPPHALWTSILVICDAAARQNTRVWIDAEQQVFQPTIDAWTVELMRHYNHLDSDRHRDCKQPQIYATFQAYLKDTPTRLARQLDLSRKEGWRLGIKLVRGAYIASEPRHLIHDTKADTDKAYDDIARGLLTRSFPLSPPSSSSVSPSSPVSSSTSTVTLPPADPEVHLFLASHNAPSIQKAYSLHCARLLASEPTIGLEFAQLQGMADEVSCELLRLCRQKDANVNAGAENKGLDKEVVEQLAPRAFKCLAWGSTRECIQFLVRRAVENKGAVGRAGEWGVGLRRELWRRVRARLRLERDVGKV